MSQHEEVAAYLLNNGYLLAALEFYEELKEGRHGHTSTSLSQYFDAKKYQSETPKKSVEGNEGEENVSEEVEMKGGGDLSAEVLKRDEQIQLLEYKNRIAQTDIWKLKEQVRQLFLEKKAQKKHFFTPQLRRRSRRRRSFGELSDLELSGGGIHQTSPLFEARQKNHTGRPGETVQDDGGMGTGKGGKNENLIEGEITPEEMKVMNYLIQLYLKEQTDYKLTLITFLDEVGNSDVVDLDKVLLNSNTNQDGLVFLYRHFLHSRPQQNLHREYENKINLLESKLKKMTRVNEELKERCEAVTKERNSLATTLEVMSLELEKKVVVSSPVSPDNGNGRSVQIGAESEEGTGTNKPPGVADNYNEAKKEETEEREGEDKDEKGPDSETVSIAYSSKIINELFEIFPAIIPAVKQQKRETVIPLIRQMLKLDHPNKNKITLYNILKRPTQKQRRLIINSLLELYPGNKEYFEKQVFPRLKKATTSKYFEKKILTVQFVGEFYPVLKNDEEKEEYLFDLLIRSGDDFHSEVRMNVLKTINNLIDLDKIPKTHAEDLADLFTKFLREEENDMVLQLLLNATAPILFQWISKSGDQLILKVATSILQEVEKNISKKVHNFSQAFIVVLRFLRKLIPDVKVEVEHKDKRGTEFKWLLEVGIPKIINLIISQEEIPHENSLSLVSILKNFNTIFGPEFHESILKRGFLLILDNDGAQQIRLIRVRLYPYFLFSICNQEERDELIQRLMVSVVEKKKNFTEKMLHKILRVLVKANTKIIPGQVLSNVEEVLKSKKQNNYRGLLLVVLRTVLPRILKYLHGRVVEVRVAKIVKEVLASRWDDEVICEALKNLGNVLIKLEHRNEEFVKVFSLHFALRKSFSNMGEIVPITTLQVFLKILKKKNFYAYEICQMIYDFLTNHLVSLLKEEKKAREVARLCCEIFEAVYLKSYVDRAEDTIKCFVEPSMKYLREMFKDDNEVKKQLKNTTKILKRKSTKKITAGNFFKKGGGAFKAVKINEEDLKNKLNIKKFKGMNIFKKKNTQK